MQPKLNVIVVSRGLWEMTRTMIVGAIFSADVPWFLHFYSNGSEDETEKEFNKVAPSWTWGDFCGYKASFREKPISLAAAWNAAYRYLPEPAEYTMFANNDIVFHKAGWMSKMIKRLDEVHLTGLQEMSWYRFRFIEGSLFVARTETLEVIKMGKHVLFDTDFKLSCEDVDLSERFLRAGLDIGQTHGLQPDYLVHIGHQTLNAVGATEDTYGKMHTSRRALCRKYGYDERIID